MRATALLMVGLVCCSKGRTPAPDPDPGAAPAPSPAPAPVPPAEPPGVIFRDASGRQLTKDDLENATGTVQWSVVGSDNVSDAAAALHEQGRAAGSRGDYAKAIELFNKAHDAAPAWPYPLYDLAYTYSLMDQPAKALPIYERVVALAPRGFFTALVSVDCLRREAAKEWPAGMCKRYQLVEFAEPGKRTAELEAIVAAAPGMAAAWKDLALDIEDDARRLAALDKALSHKPDPETRGVILTNKALVLDRLGKRAEAIAILGELALDPKSPLDVEQLSKMALAQMTSRSQTR
jgi:tetratricopeptide (TPR) repeat protein